MEPQLFACTSCDYTTYHEGNYNKHLKTQKHKEKTEFKCHHCGNFYKHQSNLYRHQQNCSMSPKNFVKDIKETVENVVQPIVMEIQEIKEDIALTNDSVTSIANTTVEMKTNIANTISEIATTVVETASANQNKIVECITTIHGNTNAMFETVVVKCVDQLTAVANAPVVSAPKKFNLETYLNETCKEAQNIEDFIKSVSPDYDDVVLVGKHGYVEGNLGVMLKYLLKLEQTKRPIQCSDAKRQTVYLKTKNKWEKDTDGLPKTSEAVNHMCNKTYKGKKIWEQRHPEHDDLNHKKSEEHQRLIHAMSGGNHDIDALNTKISNKVIKSCVIEK